MAARSRPRADADQPRRRPGPAVVLQVPDRRRDREGAGGAASEAGMVRWPGDARPGRDLVRPVADPRRGRAEGHHGHAAPRRRARDAPAGALLRYDPDRRAHLARHERRRGHPESGGHGARAARRQYRHGGARARVPALLQLAADVGDDRGAGGVRRRHGLRVQDVTAAVPRPRQDSGGGHRPPESGARRRSCRQDLHGRAA